MKGFFTCELKKDINPNLELQKEILEKLHPGFMCTIYDVTYKRLHIGLIEVHYKYDFTQY